MYVTKEEFHETIERLERGMNASFAAIAQHLKALETIVFKMDERFDRMDERFDRMDERFDRMDERFDRMDKRFDRMEVDFANTRREFYSRFELSSAHLQVTDQVQKRTDDRLFSLERRVSALEQERRDNPKK